MPWASPSKHGWICSSFSIWCNKLYWIWRDISSSYPLQPVALALRQSPPVVSIVVPTTSATSRESKPTAKSDHRKERRPPQKQKFQELPAGSNGSTNLNQGLEPYKPSRQSDDVFMKNVSPMVAPKKLIQPSSNGIPPPVPRNMPPPPPKFPAPPVVEVYNKNKISNKTNSSTVPDTLVKLREYGEEDESLMITAKNQLIIPPLSSGLKSLSGLYEPFMLAIRDVNKHLFG